MPFFGQKKSRGLIFASRKYQFFSVKLKDCSTDVKNGIVDQQGAYCQYISTLVLKDS